MGGLNKKGPKRKKRRRKLNNSNINSNDRGLTDDDFKRMMEDAPVYKRHNGAIKQVK